MSNANFSIFVKPWQHVHCEDNLHGSSVVKLCAKDDPMFVPTLTIYCPTREAGDLLADALRQVIRAAERKEAVDA